jgi:hypothetical protein
VNISNRVMVKNQHYVPRFYLKHFTNAQGQCWTFYKDQNKAFLSNPQNIASERFFYDLPEFDQTIGIDQPVEKYLAEVESLYSPFLNDLIGWIDRREISRLSEDMRAILCDFMMFQIIRTKEHRESMSQGMAQFQEQLAASGWLSNDMIIQMRENHTEEQVKQSHLEQLFFDTDFKTKLITILNTHIWLLFKNTTQTLYYTSDHPVVKVPHLQRKHRNDNGYKSEGIEIAMPLSSTHLLVLVERKMFKHYEEYENEILVHKDAQNVTYYNAMQVSQSYRGIYCASNQFDHASEMVNTHSELRQLNHDRFGPA